MNAAWLCLLLIAQLATAQQTLSPAVVVRTTVTGKVTDQISGQPLQYINVSFPGSSYVTTTDKSGQFSLSAAGAFKQVSFSFVGYQPVLQAILPGQVNEVSVELKTSKTQLNEVNIVSGKHAKYRNKGNPAVELIQQVIDHKAQNRMESADYVQYNQYERIGLSLFNLSRKLINSKFFRKYQFMLDTTTIIDKQKQTSLPG